MTPASPFVEAPIADQVEAATALLRRMHGEDCDIPAVTLHFPAAGSHFLEAFATFTLECPPRC